MQRIGDIIDKKQLLKLERSFENFKNLTYRKMFMNLYQEYVYYPLMIECYENMFHKRHSKELPFHYCPNANQCELPPVKRVHCTNVYTYYKRFAFLENNLFFHVPYESEFKASRDGCVV